MAAEAGSDEQGLEGVQPDGLLRELLIRVDEALDEQARLRLLLDAVVSMAADLSLDGVLARIVTTASNLVHARYAALDVLDVGRDGGQRTFVHHGMTPAQVADIGELPTREGLLGLIIDRPLRMSDLGEHPAAHGLPEGHPPMKSFLGVPVRIRDRAFGNLYLTEKAGGVDFTQEDEDIVVALAAAAGVAVENARLYEESAMRQGWLAATAEIAAVLADPASGEQALRTVADRARTVAEADVSWIATGRDPETLTLAVVSGADVDLEAVRSIPLQGSLAERVVLTREVVSVANLAEQLDVHAPDARLGLQTLGPAVVVPLHSIGGVEGVLGLAWSAEHADRFETLDPALPSSFAKQAGLALELARARDDQQRLAVYQDRDRIGRDLHDLVIQRLFAVGLGLESASRTATDPALAARLEQAVDDLDGTIKDIRSTIFALGSIADSADVQAEVMRLVDRAEATLKFRPTLTIDGPIRTAVPPHVVPDLLAVLGEALSNTGRHADASSVDVRVAVGDEILVSVADDGRGFGDDVKESGLGNMRERALKHGGSFVVASTTGQGTTVEWRVPATS